MSSSFLSRQARARMPHAAALRRKAVQLQPLRPDVPEPVNPEQPRQDPRRRRRTESRLSDLQPRFHSERRSPEAHAESYGGKGSRMSTFKEF